MMKMLRKFRLAKELKRNMPWIQVGVLGTLAGQSVWGKDEPISFKKRTGYLTCKCHYDYHYLNISIVYHDPKTDEDITVSTLCYDVHTSTLVVGKQEMWDLHLIEDAIKMLDTKRNETLQKETV